MTEKTLNLFQFQMTLEALQKKIEESLSFDIEATVEIPTNIKVVDKDGNVFIDVTESGIIWEDEENILINSSYILDDGNGNIIIN